MAAIHFFLLFLAGFFGAGLSPANQAGSAMASVLKMPFAQVLASAPMLSMMDLATSGSICMRGGDNGAAFRGDARSVMREMAVGNLAADVGLSCDVGCFWAALKGASGSSGNQGDWFDGIEAWLSEAVALSDTGNLIAAGACLGLVMWLFSPGRRRKAKRRRAARRGRFLLADDVRCHVWPALVAASSAGMELARICIAAWAISLVLAGLMLGGMHLVRWWVGRGVWRAFRKARAAGRYDEDCECEACAFGEWLASPRDQAGADPFGAVDLMRPLPLEAGDVVAISEALLRELEDVSLLVKSAEVSLSVEDYGEALAGAQRRLSAVTKCLRGLRGRMMGIHQPRTCE